MHAQRPIFVASGCTNWDPLASRSFGLTCGSQMWKSYQDEVAKLLPRGVHLVQFGNAIVHWQEADVGPYTRSAVLGTPQKPTSDVRVNVTKAGPTRVRESTSEVVIESMKNLNDADIGGEPMLPAHLNDRPALDAPQMKSADSPLYDVRSHGAPKGSSIPRDAQCASPIKTPRPIVTYLSGARFPPLSQDREMRDDVDPLTPGVLEAIAALESPLGLNMTNQLLCGENDLEMSPLYGLEPQDLDEDMAIDDIPIDGFEMFPSEAGVDHYTNTVGASVKDGRTRVIAGSGEGLLLTSTELPAWIEGGFKPKPKRVRKRKRQVQSALLNSWAQSVGGDMPLSEEGSAALASDTSLCRDIRRQCLERFEERWTPEEDQSIIELVAPFAAAKAAAGKVGSNPNFPPTFSSAPTPTLSGCTSACPQKRVTA